MLILIYEVGTELSINVLYNTFDNWLSRVKAMVTLFLDPTNLYHYKQAADNTLHSFTFCSILTGDKPVWF